MATFAESLGTAARQALCSYVSDVERANSWLRGINPLTPQAPSGFARGFVCDQPGPHSVPGPFEGGQCPGVLYSVSGDIVESSPPLSPFGFGVTNVPGPISLRKTPISGTSDCRFAIYSGDTESRFLSNRPCTEVFANVTVTRQDGQPDDCGDPDPITPIPPFPPEGDTVNIDFDYTDNSGQNRSVNGTLNLFAPVLLAPVTVFAPIRVDLPDFSLDGTITFAPSFEINFGARSLPDTGTPIGDIPIEDEPAADDDPIACTDAPLLGLSVSLQFSADMRPTALSQDLDIPPIGVPRAAILYWIARVGGEDIWLPGIDLKQRYQFVIAPQEVAVTCWRIHTEPGVTVGLQVPSFRDSAPPS